MPHKIAPIRRHEIPGHIAITAGNGGLPKILVTTKTSSAEIYLHGAHVTGFQKNGEPPLIFMSRKSYFAPGKPPWPAIISTAFEFIIYLPNKSICGAGARDFNFSRS